MKIFLVTTTIHIPKLLELASKFGPDVFTIVVGDRKTPASIVDFLHDIPNHAYYGADLLQHYKCAKFIGQNSVQKRNLGYLEALKLGADIIYSWDDDNAFLSEDHFFQINRLLGLPFSGLQVMSGHGWFDPGQLLEPRARHRGYPHDSPPNFQVAHAIDAKVAVAAGLCLGNPDVSAVDRISRAPYVHGVTELARAGVVCDPNVHTVWNSQNTSVIRELVPAMFLWPGSRHDDIYASLVMQRIMRERDWRVHFGRPFVHQERNQHDLIKDLRAEIDGMEKIKELAGLFGQAKLGEGSVIDQTGRLFSNLAYEAGLAWLSDCEEVL